MTYDDLTSLNEAPGSCFDPRTIDDRVPAKDTQCLHAEYTTVKPDLLHATVASLLEVGVPLFMA